MQIKAKVDMLDIRKRMTEYATLLNKDVSDSLRRFARVACVNLATATQPFGKDKVAKDMGETAVSRDIHKVYYPATGSKFLNQATNLARGHYKTKGRKNASQLADKFRTRLIGYQMAENTEAMTKIAADMGFTRALFDRFDPSYHKAARDRRGRVRRPKPYLVIGAEDQMDKYIDRKQRMVGLTKAGWAKAADMIPTSIKGSATRGIPQWVTRNKAKSDAAIKDLSRDRINPRVIMTNKIPWTSQVLTSKQAYDALQLARKNFVKYMNTTMRAELRRRSKLGQAAA